MRDEPADFYDQGLRDSSRQESRAFGRAGAEFEWKMTDAVLMTDLGMGD